jgi:hypothetical protein
MASKVIIFKNYELTSDTASFKMLAGGIGDVNFTTKVLYSQFLMTGWMRC